MTDLMIRHGLASRGKFVLIAPALNRRAQAVAKLYAAELLDPAGDTASDHVGFVSLTLEQVVAAIASAGGSSIARPFYERYCDLHRVAHCALEDSSPSPTPPAAAGASPGQPAAEPDTSAVQPLRQRRAARAKGTAHPRSPARQRSAAASARTSGEAH